MRERILFLDGLRGLAALMVVLYHLWTEANAPHLPVKAGSYSLDILAPLELLGGSRVSLFFVLSGFLLYLPFARDSGNDRASVTLSEWLGQRFRRLAPPYYAAIPLALASASGTYYLTAFGRWIRHQPQGPPLPENLLAAFPESLFFLHGVVPGSELPRFNGPLWTLTPEVELYIAFPLLLAIARGFQVGGRRYGGLAFAVTFAVALSLLYRFYLYVECGRAARWYGAELVSEYHCLVHSFLGRWAEFALGMGAAGCIVARRVPSAWLLAPACAVSMGLFLWVRVAWGTGPIIPPCSDALGGVAFTLLVLCCAAIPRMEHVFTRRPLVLVGSFSYSLYLVHVPVLGWLRRALEMVWHGDVAHGGVQLFALNLIIGLPVALLVGRLFWWAFERPFLSLRRRVSLEGNPPARATSSRIQRLLHGWRAENNRVGSDSAADPGSSHGA